MTQQQHSHCIEPQSSFATESQRLSTNSNKYSEQRTQFTSFIKHPNASGSVLPMMYDDIAISKNDEENLLQIQDKDCGRNWSSAI